MKMSINDNKREDLHGRINSFDQNLRSLERRLRAVERRLSMEVPPHDLVDYPVSIQTDLLQQMRMELTELREHLSYLGKKDLDSWEGDINNLKQQFAQLQQHISILDQSHQQTKQDLLNTKPDESMLKLTHAMKDQLDDMERRLKKAEDRNRITIGSVKVPMELSGLVAAVLIFLTGILIMYGRWEIIRSPYFSFAIALMLGGAVLLRFYVANKETERA
jgi:chromosome segregation ATPase